MSRVFMIAHDRRNNLKKVITSPNGRSFISGSSNRRHRHQRCYCDMNRLWSVVFCVILMYGLCEAQVNFTPGWGKRGLSQGGGSGDAGCKAPIESLMYIYKLVQSEAQKIVDCERLSNIIRYLGVELESRMNHVGHFEKVTALALGVAGALAGILPNIAGPSDSSAETTWWWSYPTVWDRLHIRSTDMVRGACQIPSRHKTAGDGVCMRVARCYRTASSPASDVIAGVPLFDVIAERLQEAYIRKRKAETDSQRRSPVDDEPERETTDGETSGRRENIIQREVATTTADGDGIWRT